MTFPSRYICAGKAFSELYHPVPAPYIRKTFYLNDSVTNATLLIGTPGFYRLWINGHEITRGHMAPYIANPDEHVYFDSYDITQYLRVRDNVIGILLGNGMQNNWGGFVWEFEKAPWRAAPCVAFRADIRPVHDAPFSVESDLECLCHDSPIQWDDERIGECYDARFEVPGWNCYGDNPRSWKPVTPAKAPKGRPHLNKATPIRTETELKPVEIIPVSDGFVYDFGVNYTGVTRLQIRGTKGQVVELLHGECMHDGDLYAKNLYFGNKESFGAPNFVQKVVYVCAGTGEEIYQPSFSYYGFRYVKVTGITPDQATKDLLTFVVMHSDIQKAGSFSSSDDVLNKLEEMTLRSDLSNFWYFPTDCPHREKNGWTGDAVLSCEQFYMNFEPGTDLRQWLENVRTAMQENGGLPGIVPTQAWGYGVGPCWDSVLTVIPYYHYRFTGDISLFRENADCIAKQIRYFDGLTEEDGKIHTGLADWCAPQHPHPYCEDSFLRMSFVAYAAKLASFMFGVIHDEQRAKECAAVAEKMRKAVRGFYVDEKTHLINFKGQSGPALALYFGICEKDEQMPVFNDLVKRIEESNCVMDTGVFGTRVLFHVLTKFGRTDLALKCILNPVCPSYASWVRTGLTTLAEMPQGLEETDSRGEFSISSLNHHFMGDISNWFKTALCGIVVNPELTDADHFILEPHLTDALTDVNGTHGFPGGNLSVSWHRDGNQATVTVTASGRIHGIFMEADGWKVTDGEKRITAGTTVIHLQK